MTSDKLTLSKYAEEALDKARELAESNTSIYEMQAHLDAAEVYSKAAGIDVSWRAKDIKRFPYRKCMEVNLEKAREYAKNRDGSVYDIISHLRTAEGYAKQANNERGLAVFVDEIISLLDEEAAQIIVESFGRRTDREKIRLKRKIEEAERTSEPIEVNSNEGYLAGVYCSDDVFERYKDIFVKAVTESSYRSSEAIRRWSDERLNGLERKLLKSVTKDSGFSFYIAGECLSDDKFSRYGDELARAISKSPEDSLRALMYWPEERLEGYGELFARSVARDQNIISEATKHLPEDKFEKYKTLITNPGILRKVIWFVQGLVKGNSLDDSGSKGSVESPSKRVMGFDERSVEIVEVGSVDEAINQARHWASKGIHSFLKNQSYLDFEEVCEEKPPADTLPTMDRYLSVAEDFARDTGRDISAEVNEIRNTIADRLAGNEFYEEIKSEMEEYLKEASTYDEETEDKGNLIIYFSSQAERYAELIGIDISKETEEIRRLKLSDEMYE